MKIRIMGTRSECEVAQGYYSALEKEVNVKRVTVSGLYPNRGSTMEFRVYVEVEYHSDILETATAQLPMPLKNRRGTGR